MAWNDQFECIQYDDIREFQLAKLKETVAWVFFNDTDFWKIDWLTLSVLFYLREEVDSLWFATTKCYFSAVQVISDAL